MRIEVSSRWTKKLENVINTIPRQQRWARTASLDITNMSYITRNSAPRSEIYLSRWRPQSLISLCKRTTDHISTEYSSFARSLTTMQMIIVMPDLRWQAFFCGATHLTHLWRSFSHGKMELNSEYTKDNCIVYRSSRQIMKNYIQILHTEQGINPAAHNLRPRIDMDLPIRRLLPLTS
jgi:hypothetical protein